MEFHCCYNPQLTITQKLQFPNANTIIILNCPFITELPALPAPLRTLTVRGCPLIRTIPSLEHLTQIEHFEIQPDTLDIESIYRLSVFLKNNPRIRMNGREKIPLLLRAHKQKMLGESYTHALTSAITKDGISQVGLPGTYLTLSNLIETPPTDLRKRMNNAIQRQTQLILREENLASVRAEKSRRDDLRRERVNMGLEDNANNNAGTKKQRKKKKRTTRNASKSRNRINK